MNLNKKTVFFLSFIIILFALHSIYVEISVENKVDINKKYTDRLLSDIVCYVDISNNIIEKEQIQSFQLNEKNILVYRFSEEMCEGCIYQDLIELYNVQKVLGKDKILVIPAYENNRYNMILLKNRLSNFRFVNIPMDSLVFPINRETGLYQRFFAYADRNGKLTSFYFPSRNQQNVTHLYLKYLKKRIEK